MSLGNSRPLTRRPVQQAIDGKDIIFVSEYLTNGGSNNMAVNGAAEPVEFVFSVPKNRRLTVGRIFIYIEGAAPFDSEKFGNLTALTNGLLIENNGSVLENWKDNVDIVTSMFDTEEGRAFAQSGRVLRCRWTFSKSSGDAIGLVLRALQFFKTTVRDDLSSLALLRIKLQGTLRRST